MTHHSYDFLDNGKEMTIVLVHAFAMDRHMWKQQIPVLSRSFNILNLDIRCHGDSDFECDTFTLENAVRDIKEILEKEHITHYILVGISLGAYILQEYFATGATADGAVFISSTPTFVHCYEPWELATIRLVEYALPFFLTPCAPHQIAASITVTPWGYWHALEHIQINTEIVKRSWNIMTRCHENPDVRFPENFLVMCGGMDFMGTIQNHMRDWRFDYPQSRLAVIPWAGHLINLDQPETFNQTLMEFALRCKEGVLGVDA